MVRRHKDDWMRRLARLIGLCRAVGAYLVVPLLVLLFGAQPPALAKPRVVLLPYRSANGLILVEAKVNGNPVTLVMDTGANHTIIDARSCGFGAVPGFDVNTRGVGISGNALRLRVDLEVGKQILFSQPVSVMNLNDLARRLGTPLDGLLGQDILRQFQSIRIDYKAHVIELQQ